MNGPLSPFSSPGRPPVSANDGRRFGPGAKLALVIHAVLVVFFVVLFEISPAPLHTNLLRWDALWYDLIRQHGYTYRAGEMNPTAFFPLFPYVWRWSALAPIGICLLNLGVFSGALLLLHRRLKLRAESVLLFTAFPTSMFFYMPYTEAFFFLASSLVLVGLAGNSSPTLGSGLIMGAFTRVTAFFYLPSLFVLEALQVHLDRQSLGRRTIKMFVCGSVTGIGLASVMLIQWAQTGTWFAFNKTQAQFLNHHLRFPSLPFVSNTSTIIVWLDGLALLVGLCAGAWAVRSIVRVVRKTAEPPPSTVLFSAVFIAVSALYTLAYAPLARDSTSTSLLSMHRYIFGTPFFLVLLDAFLPRQTVPFRRMLLGLLPVLLLTACLGLVNGKSVALYLMREPIVIPGLIYASFI